MNALESALAEGRPDVIGGVTVRQPDGRYCDFIYFTSEADARAGEAKEMPEEMAAEFEAMMNAVEIEEYLDLRDPWLH
jgi:hypothetical protein